MQRKLLRTLSLFCMVLAVMFVLLPFQKTQAATGTFTEYDYGTHIAKIPR